MAHDQTALILYGIDEIRWCLQRGTDSEQIAALAIAAQRGSDGLALIIHTLAHPNPNLQQAALMLLRDRPEPAALHAIRRWLQLPTPSAALDLDPVQTALVQQQWQVADTLTCAAVLAVANRPGAWLRAVDVERLPQADLACLDQLWRFYSGDRFGFSLQAQLWAACEQAECTPTSYSAFDVSYCFSRRVGWHLKIYDRSYLADYDFRHSTKMRYNQTSPVGSLPSTFALGGGSYQLEFERGDTESTMGFYGGDRTYYTWSQDALFGHDLLRLFLRRFSGFPPPLGQS